MPRISSSFSLYLSDRSPTKSPAPIREGEVQAFSGWTLRSVQIGATATDFRELLEHLRPPLLQASSNRNLHGATVAAANDHVHSLEGRYESTTAKLTHGKKQVTVGEVRARSERRGSGSECQRGPRKGCVFRDHRASIAFCVL